MLVDEEQKEEHYKKTFNPLWIIADIGIALLKVLCKIIWGFFYVLGVAYTSVGWLFSFVINILLMLFAGCFIFSLYAFFHGELPFSSIIAIFIVLAVVVVIKVFSDSLGEIFVNIGDFIGELFDDLKFQSPIRYIKETKKIK